MNALITGEKLWAKIRAERN